MSEIENPVDTVIRLLSKNMWVVREDGSLANIHVGHEWVDHELFKNYDGQITVGLAESHDTKIEISGRLRRRLGTLRVNVWSQNMLTRQKMVEEVNRVVRQNRNRPNETLYNFRGVGRSTETHKAYSAGSADELSPSHASWNELSDLDYQKIWYSDDVRYSKSHNVNGEYALMLFRFKIESRENAVKKVVLTFEGYGAASSGNGVTIKVWNNVSGAWEQAQTSVGGADETLTITLTLNARAQNADFGDDA